MAVDTNKLEELLKELPEELQGEVIEFAETLLQKSRRGSSGSAESESASVRAFFGSWDSGDSRFADNDRIDADLACEYASAQQKDS